MSDKMSTYCITEVEGGEVFSGVWAAGSMGEALNNYSWLCKLGPGDVVKLSNGTDAVVMQNDQVNKRLLLIRPHFINSVESSTMCWWFDYNAIKLPFGQFYTFNELVRLMGREQVRECIEEENWENAAEFIKELHSIGEDISEFRDNLCTIIKHLPSNGVLRGELRKLYNAYGKGEE